MNDAKKGFQSDDEEDLEALRLAALQTLKKTSTDSISSQSPVRNLPYRAPNKPRGNYTNKRGRFYGGRGLKNGQFHGGRTISSNLIPLTPSPLEINSSKPSEEIKLHLPQDNYLNKSTEESKPNEISTKFDRYKDKSEEEDTEDELLRSDSDDDVSPSSAKLERSDSLEALMQELTDEIQGKSTTTQQPKTKVKTKRKKEAPVVKLKEETIVQKVEEETKQKVEEEIQTVQKVEEKTVQEVVEPQLKNHKKFQPQNTYQRYRNNFQQPFVPQFPPTYAPEIAYTPYVPPFRPLSPLHISAETLQTQTMAPLSPRSAAFVLENRAIVEKRKRSPRRSPSFSPRRSLTPIRRRSLSPRKRSLTPKRKSPSPLPRKRSRSPKRRTFSPKRRPTSPKRRSASPRRRAAKSKPSIRERLGVKSSAKIEENESKDKKPECSSQEKDAKPLDPVLEARKKKFENKEIKVREGVIRLKPKEEARSVATETKIVEEPLDEDELDINTDLDIFFDEDESASEIEAKKEDKVLVNGVKERPKLPEPAKKKLGVKLDRNLRKFDRKIEIKIKNPSKYQQADKEKEKSKKVEVSLPQSYKDEEDDDTEIIVEDDKDENNMSNEGDLRAQLSKKRAEKRQKHTRKEVMTSRLLQNALQNVLPVKKKSKKSSKLSSTDIDSGKMPIRLRLGLAHTLDTSKPKNKSKKRKLSEIDSEDQV